MLSASYKALLAFYQAKLKEHGTDDPQALSYNSRTTQELRFAQFLKIIPRDQPATVLDVGCGLGDLAGFLERNHYKQLAYTGLDIVPEMIAGAIKKHPQQKFLCADLFTAQLPSYDYVVSSGALNIIFTTSAEQSLYIEKAIQLMWSLAQKGLAFNLLNRHSQAQFEPDPHFFYSDPSQVLSFCQKLCPRTRLVDNYLDHDFTIAMEKKQTLCN